MTALKAIRAKCLDCMCDQQAEVRRCPCIECPLYPFRMGHNPRKRELSEAQRATLEKHRFKKRIGDNIAEFSHELSSGGKNTSGEETWRNGILAQ